MSRILLLLFLFAVGYQNGFSQQLEEWEVYPSFSTVNALTTDGDHFYAATSGGVFIVDQNESEIAEILTTMEGLYRADPMSIVYDHSAALIFTGYVDGTIDVIDVESYSIQRLEDIKRVDRFNSKSINDLIIYEGELYVATNFGVVVYDLQTLLVNNSYTKLGTLNTGTAVNGLDIADNTIYVATSQGIAIGDIESNLIENTNWEIINEQSGLPTNLIDQVQYFNSTLYALGLKNLYSLSNETWTEEDITTYGISSIRKSEDGSILGISAGKEFIQIDGENNNRRQRFEIETSITKFILSQEAIIVGTETEGVLTFNTQTEEQTTYLPSGPYQNYFSGMSIDNGILISASTNESAGSSVIDRSKGYYIYDGSDWENYNSRTNEVIQSFRYQQSFTTTITNEYYYIGSWGRGVARHHREDNEVHIFDETNSLLRGYVDDSPLFPVISGLQTDSNDDVWLTSRYGDTPLYYQTPGDEDWMPLPKAGATSSSDEYFGLFIDSFDQKWITLENVSTAGSGLLVLDTGTDPKSISDDASVKLTTGGGSGNLPDNKVNAIVQDKNNEIWIGTGRGIARFIFPELIVEGGANERQAQWLINEDTTASSRFLLRDVNVSAIAVNSANQKWIGSVNQGIWVLNDEGSRIIKRFTTENSPLYSDNVRSIAINDETGEVFIATDLGLMSYFDIPKAPVNKMNTLKVFPNPFSYSKHSQIVIEGLSDDTQIKIIGIDGTVVQELTAAGGRTSWNALSYSGSQLGSGVYYVVAYEDDGRQTGIGKVVIIK